MTQINYKKKPRKIFWEINAEINVNISRIGRSRAVVASRWEYWRESHVDHVEHICMVERTACHRPGQRRTYCVDWQVKWPGGYREERPGCLGRSSLRLHIVGAQALELGGEIPFFSGPGTLLHLESSKCRVLTPISDRTLKDRIKKKPLLYENISSNDDRDLKTFSIQQRRQGFKTFSI